MPLLCECRLHQQVIDADIASYRAMHGYTELGWTSYHCLLALFVAFDSGLVCV